MGGQPLFCVTACTMTGCLCCHFVCMLCGGFLFSPSSRRGKVTYFTSSSSQGWFLDWIEIIRGAH